MSHDCSILYLDQLNGFTKIFKSQVDDRSSRVPWFEIQSKTADVIEFSRLASVDDSFGENFVQAHSSAPLPTKPVVSPRFADVLKSFPNQALFKYLKYDGDGGIAFFLDPFYGTRWLIHAQGCTKHLLKWQLRVR